MDDAGVVRVDDDLALVQTIDVFPPVVDDPYWYGRIAAANSLSDVYAMGARPVSAVNFVGYPLDELGPEPLTEILRGSFDALEEADCAMAGGHSIRDKEVKFGLAVTGLAAPDRFLRNSSARPGDHLVLTKPLGMGCLCTALRQGKAAPDDIEAGQRVMARLNRNAAEAMLRAEASAATDITGYGLLGHAIEMAIGANRSFRIDPESLPVLDQAKPYLLPEFTCGGSQRNAEFTSHHAVFDNGVTDLQRLLLNDVQTSGGLLISVAPERVDALLEDLRAGGDETAATIGNVLPDGPAVVVS
jgi:selenide,water dikinase